MAGAIPIYQGQDFYVPQFQVKLQGRPQGQEVVRDIIQVTYKDDIEQVDSFEITINNWDADTRHYKYTNESLFDPGKELELWMGYYGKDRLRLMIKGEITALRPNFPPSGQPTLAISGLNLIHSLRQEQRSQVYENMKDSQIAQQIGGQLNIKVRTDAQAMNAEPTYQHLAQNNQYDIVFLLERARRLGYDLFVEERGENGQARESQLYFGPSQHVRKVTYKLTYGKSLIQFQPTLNLANQVGEVKVQGWDQTRKQKIEYTARRSQIVTKGNPRFEKAFKQRKEILNRPIESEAEARQLATETLERIAKEMIKGSGSTVGLPDLRAGNVIEIDGLDELFDGRYFVTATTHTIDDSGYITKFECRREDI